MDNLSVFIGQGLDRGRWQELYEDSSYASPFQSIGYFEFFKCQENMDAEVFAVQGSHKKYTCLAVVAMFWEPGNKRRFSSRGIVYGGPLVRGSDQHKDLDLLLKSMFDFLKSRVVYLEIRNLSNYSGYGVTFRDNHWEYLPYLNIKQELSFRTLTEYLDSLVYHRRNQIRQSLKAGLSYRSIAAMDEIDDIYAILLELYHNKLHLPLPHLSYFRELWKQNLAAVFVVLDGTKVVGGAICPFNDKKSIFTYYYCGIRGYKKNVYPTHLAILACVDFAIKHGIKILDFMGAGKKGETYGVRQYKLEFGGELVEEGRYRKVTKRLTFKIGEFGLYLSKKLGVKN